MPGQATVSIMVLETPPNGNSRRLYGSAFFIDAHHLLTAGHNVVHRDNVDQKIFATYAGYPIIDNSSNLLECQLVHNLHTVHQEDPKRDIAILRVRGHAAGSFLPRFRDLKLSPGQIIDVVGYPGTIMENFMALHKGLNNTKAAREAMTSSLPPRTLSASRGLVEEIGEDLIRYTAATCQGMSGGPLMANNQVHGTSLHREKFLIVGIHLGMFGDPDKNTALSLASPVVAKFLDDHLGERSIVDESEWVIRSNNQWSIRRPSSPKAISENAGEKIQAGSSCTIL